MEQNLFQPASGLKESARIEKKPAQGVEAHWNPVAVASWLHTVRKRRLRELDEIFLKKQDLEAWRSDWEKESDRLRNRSGFIGWFWSVSRPCFLLDRIHPPGHSLSPALMSSAPVPA
ncbi:hypothetical protein [Burkholderia cenocepacia]|uniref:hypothetical protein n=1 Tax=Burkholderia cenocepacia TaxID=95486 RepID=UPI00187D58EE|nr:hypothetical protein [Burkholderia cenocepacia]